MSVYGKLVEAAKNGTGCEGAEWAKFRECFPLIAELFDGKRDAEGRWEIGPATLVFWVELGVLHCCITPKYFTKVAFTTIPDVLSPFEGLQSQLAADRYEWKLGRKSR